MKQKVAVSIEERLLAEIDGMVEEERFESRSAAVEAGLGLLRRRELDAQLDRALDALTPEDVAEMQAMADEGLADYARLLEEHPW